MEIDDIEEDSENEESNLPITKWKTVKKISTIKVLGNLIKRTKIVQF